MARHAQALCGDLCAGQSASILLNLAPNARREFLLLIDLEHGEVRALYNHWIVFGHVPSDCAAINRLAIEPRTAGERRGKKSREPRIKIWREPRRDDPAKA